MSCHYVDITNTSASIFNVETTSVHDVVSTSFQRNLPAGMPVKYGKRQAQSPVVTETQGIQAINNSTSRRIAWPSRLPEP